MGSLKRDGVFIGCFEWDLSMVGMRNGGFEGGFVKLVCFGKLN